MTLLDRTFMYKGGPTSIHHQLLRLLLSSLAKTRQMSKGRTSAVQLKSCIFYCWLKIANFDIYLALMIAIEQWGFFIMPHLLWHGASGFEAFPKDPGHSHLLLRKELKRKDNKDCRSWPQLWHSETRRVEKILLYKTISVKRALHCLTRQGMPSYSQFLDTVGIILILHG